MQLLHCNDRKELNIYLRYGGLYTNMVFEALYLHKQ